MYTYISCVWNIALAHLYTVPSFSILLLLLLLLSSLLLFLLLLLFVIIVIIGIIVIILGVSIGELFI